MREQYIPNFIKIFQISIFSEKKIGLNAVSKPDTPGLRHFLKNFPPKDALFREHSLDHMKHK